MEEINFENLVTQAVNLIPQKFKDELDNVSFVIEDFPTPYQAYKMRLKHKWQLFGLYEGVPLTKRNSNYAGVLPDKITLFKFPLMRYARDLEHLKILVNNVVWHEVAHYFGMDEAEVRAAEKKRGMVY